MIKEAIGYGSTIEEAKENAVLKLNAKDGADIQFDVITCPKKKVLGLFGGAQAQVKAYYDDGVEEKKEATADTSAKEKYRAFKEWKKNPRHKALYQLLCWFAFFGIVYLVAISGLFTANYVPRTDKKDEVQDSLENYLNMDSYEYEYSILQDSNKAGKVFRWR